MKKPLPCLAIRHDHRMTTRQTTKNNFLADLPTTGTDCASVGKHFRTATLNTVHRLGELAFRMIPSQLRTILREIKALHESRMPSTRKDVFSPGQPSHYVASTSNASAKVDGPGQPSHHVVSTPTQVHTNGDSPPQPTPRHKKTQKH